MELMNRSALVIGSGPNGLSAAIVLAQAGWQVEVHEAATYIGGACSSRELTLPGFIHDVGSAVHPLAIASPFFSGLPLPVTWIHSPVALAHPLDDGTAVLLHRDIANTAANLGKDGKAWQSLFSPLLRNWEILRHELLAPLGWTRHPLAMVNIGVNALWPASSFLKTRFQSTQAQALFSGLAAHYPYVDQPLSAGFGLVLGLAAHAVGWPIPHGGAQQISNTLALKLASFGGRVLTGSPISRLTGEHSLVMADTSPQALARIAAARLPSNFARQLSQYRFGPGAFKMDWALSQPIPWQAKECAQAATVHLGGTAEEILASERAAVEGKLSDKPFVLLAQPTLFDPSRAPAGKHTVWAYCHVPAGSDHDMSAAIESQIERFAPGFRECIVARHVSPPSALQRANANLVGGDVTGGVSNLLQTLFRPTRRRYGTPDPGIYLCSSSTPPGAGVHGMCGYHAAHAALRKHG